MQNIVLKKEDGCSQKIEEQNQAIMGRNWAELPSDLLRDICKRLEYAEYLAAFSSICQSWNAAGREVKAKWTSEIPWLMLRENKEDYLSTKWTVVDFSIKKRYIMELPETFGRRCWGCDDGWICTLGLDMEFHLFNPFTRARIRLPTAHSLTLLDCAIHFNDLGDLRWFRSCCIQDVTLFKVTSTNDMLICLTYNSYSLAFAKPEDSQWFVIEHPNNNPDMMPFVEDVVSCKEQLLVLYDDGELQNLGHLDRIIGNQEEFIPEVYVPGECNGAVSLYGEGSPENLHLVESKGDLFVVLPYTKLLEFFGDVGEEPGTWWLRVLKFDSKEKNWVQVEDIGDVSLFVGKISSMAVCTSNAVHCKPSSIYYIEDKTSGHDLVLYSLEDLLFGKINVGDDTLLKVRSPFWFMPKLV